MIFQLKQRFYLPFTSIGIVSISLFSISVPSFADSAAQAQALLSAFSAGCPSIGEWTKAAVGSAGQLRETLVSLANDADCKSLAGSIGSLQLVQSSSQRIESDYETKRVRQLRALQEDLLLQIANTNDPALLASLNSQLRLIQSELVGAESNREYQDGIKKEQDMASALETLVLSTQIMLSQSIANQHCLEKHPSVLTGIAALTGAVSSALTTGGLSLGIAAGTELIGQLVEQSRKNKIAQKIQSMSESLTYTAYSCALESFSRQWCAADDTRGVVKLKGESLAKSSFTENDPTPTDPILRGTRILDLDLPSFLGWLEKVRSGASPATSAAGTRQAEVIEREAKIRQSEIRGEGMIAEHEQLFNATQSDDPAALNRARWVIERKLIYSLYALGAQSPTLIEMFDSYYIPYFLLGLELNQVPRPNGVPLTFDQFDPFNQWPEGGFVPEINIVRTRYAQWISLAKRRIQVELGLILQPDPLQLIYDAASRDLRGKTAYESGVALAQFLRDQKPKSFVVGSHERLYKETTNKIQLIVESISKVVGAERGPDGNFTDPVDPARELATIYGIASLDYGVVILQGRIQRAIRISLNEALLGQDDDAARSAASRLLAANDLIAELQRYSTATDLNMLDQDLMRSQALTERNLQTFAEVFSHGIERVKKSLAVQAYGPPEPHRSRNAQFALSELCLRLLSVPQLPKGISVDSCVGAQLSSVFPNGPKSIRIDKSSFALPHEKRVCAHRDYVRLNKLYQDRLTRR